MFEKAKKWLQSEEEEVKEERARATEKYLDQSYDEQLKHAQELLEQARDWSRQTLNPANRRAVNEFRNAIDNLKIAVSGLKSNRAHIPNFQDPNVKDFDYMVEAGGVGIFRVIENTQLIDFSRRQKRRKLSNCA